MVFALKIALVMLAIVLTVIFTCDMIFRCYYRRKLEYRMMMIKGLSAFIKEAAKKDDSREKQA